VEEWRAPCPEIDEDRVVAVSHRLQKDATEDRGLAGASFGMQDDAPPLPGLLKDVVNRSSTRVAPNQEFVIRLAPANGEAECRLPYFESGGHLLDGLAQVLGGLWPRCITRPSGVLVGGRRLPGRASQRRG